MNRRRLTEIELGCLLALYGQRAVTVINATRANLDAGPAVDGDDRDEQAAGLAACIDIFEQALANWEGGHG